MAKRDKSSFLTKFLWISILYSLWNKRYHMIPGSYEVLSDKSLFCWSIREFPFIFFSFPRSLSVKHIKGSIDKTEIQRNIIKLSPINVLFEICVESGNFDYTHILEKSLKTSLHLAILITCKYWKNLLQSLVLINILIFVINFFLLLFSNFFHQHGYFTYLVVYLHFHIYAPSCFIIY